LEREIPLTQLAAPLFQQIVSALDARVALEARVARDEAPGGSRGTGSRRRERRVGVRASATLIPLTANDTLAAGPIVVPLRDLSAAGMGFLHTGKVELDEQFVVLLPHGAGGDPVAVLCRVVYYQPLAERVFAVGAEFVRVLRQPAEDGPAPLPLPVQPGGGLRRVAS